MGIKVPEAEQRSAHGAGLSGASMGGQACGCGSAGGAGWHLRSGGCLPTGDGSALALVDAPGVDDLALAVESRHMEGGGSRLLAGVGQDFGVGAPGLGMRGDREVLPSQAPLAPSSCPSQAAVTAALG